MHYMYIQYIRNYIIISIQSILDSLASSLAIECVSLFVLKIFRKLLVDFFVSHVYFCHAEIFIVCGNHDCLLPITHALCS